MEINKKYSKKALKDFKLVEEALNGDEKAYAKLMGNYRNAVYYTILKMVRNVDDAEDLTIEVFGKAFKNIKKFKKTYSFSTWIFRIATNHCIDFLRKKKLNTLSINVNQKNKSSIQIETQEPNPQDLAIKAQRIRIVREFVELLPKKYKRLVKLRYFDELSYDEIAKKTESPLGTIKAQLYRAKELLYDIAKNAEDRI